MFNKISLHIPPYGLIIFTLLFLMGCNSSDVNKQSSITSGTTTGSGSSGGAAAKVTVTSGNNQLVSGGTTTITVIITDSQGKRTDATITLTSSRGGSFNNSTTYTTWSGNTIGGSLIITYTAPSDTIDTEITAAVTGTSIKGSTIISITSNTASTPSTFTATAYRVTNTAGTYHGTITPDSQTVNSGSTAIFILNPDSGYTASVSGTCGGTLAGNTYTTNPITANCTVIASFN
ncbi:MAG: hypothetical protein L7F78_27855 [Syntrophales bacterium LBB04]|nr:hypothetical protein [Syntrophales bacterium LBB04]